MNKKIILPVLFFGSLWGIAEAALGYLLHLIPFGVSGFIMFPIGFYFMYCAYKRTHDIKSIFFTGLVASAVKLIDLALPFMPVIKILTPCASIIFESFAVALSYKLFKSMQNRICICGIVSSSLGWRVMFLLLQYVLTLFGIQSKYISGGTISMVSFVLWQGLINVVILYIFSYFANRKSLNILGKKKINTQISIATFITAMGLSIAFSLI
ncbi:MAG: hypothetical protein GYA50_04210 [Eubacteriaceae bacterium]|nr:hypothetical protein [Eubacteriaceae bacterium]